MIKKFLMILICSMSFSIAQAACHEVDENSDEYRDPRPVEIDSLCIDEKDYVIFYKEKQVQYHFQSRLETRNVGHSCRNTGRAESSSCGYRDGDLFLIYNDNRVAFKANVHSNEEVSSGAQLMEYNGRLYKFWVRGRR
jgi:hypothetical protein